MPRGDKSDYTDKQKRKAEHIEEGYEDRGVSEKEAERRAWATVNKESGGGNKSGSGRGKKDTHVDDVEPAIMLDADEAVGRRDLQVCACPLDDFRPACRIQQKKAGIVEEDAAGEFRDIDAMCERRAALGGVEDDLGRRRCDFEPL